MEFFQWKRFKCKGSVLISTIIAGALIGILGIGCSRLMGAVMNAANATHIATQAEQYAKAQAGLLRGTKYEDLAAIAKKNITSDGTFKSEVLMGAESVYDTSTNQRTMTVNVYHENDTLPIYSLDVPRYSKEVGGAEDYIVEQWHSGSEWYRVWKSGFIEQGGNTSVSRHSFATVNLRKPFSNGNYTVSCNGGNYTDTGDWAGGAVRKLSASQIQMIGYVSVSISWRCEGY